MPQPIGGKWEVAVVKVGWIGLGEMGAPMAGRVAAAGHDLTIFDRGGGRADLRAAGATMSSSYGAVAGASDLLCVCVYDDDQVRDVLIEKGALAAMTPGSILAIHTTGSPLLARTLHAAAPTGVSVLDAAFSGAPAKARDGRLTLMVGGDRSALEAARAVFQAYANTIHHVGGPGAGQSMKLLNNILFASNLQLARKALRVGDVLGLDQARVVSALQDCSGASSAMELFSGGSMPGEVLARVAPYLRKDIATAEAAAADVGIDLGLLRQVARQPDDAETA